MKKKNIVSTFDGASCGRVALDLEGIKYDNYFAFEIDKDAIKVAQDYNPNTIQKGSVNDFSNHEIKDVFLFMGGSPCQSFSRSGDGSGFDGKSGLFWKYIEMLKHYNPKYFFLENVVMKKEWEKIITEQMGVEPIKVDSKYFSAQKRQRLYWTNIPFDKNFIDKNISIKDIFDESERLPISQEKRDEIMWFEENEYRVVNATKKGYLVPENYDVINLDFPKSKTRRGRVSKQKSNTLNTSCNQGIFIDGEIYKLTTLECERLQTFPDNHTSILTESKRRNVIGNGWTIEVIRHFFKNLK